MYGLPDKEATVILYQKDVNSYLSMMTVVLSCSYRLTRTEQSMHLETSTKSIHILRGEKK
jgi:hypothetical protein